MLNNKIKARLRSQDERMSQIDNAHYVKYWELRHDLDLLVAELGLCRG